MCSYFQKVYVILILRHFTPTPSQSFLGLFLDGLQHHVMQFTRVRLYKKDEDLLFL